MLKDITINLNAIENMLFFWQSVMEGERVSEFYLSDLAKSPEIAPIYDESFNETSFRKVLSAVTNKERLNTEIPKERQFWNKNMYITEDPEVLKLVVQPLKTLNLDNTIAQLNEKADFPFEALEVVFIPGFNETSFQKGNQLYINFFKVSADLFGSTNAVTIENKEIPTYIIDRIVGMDGVSLKV